MLPFKCRVAERHEIMIRLAAYITDRGEKPFEEWFSSLDVHAANNKLIILLGGGAKKQQQKDIEQAEYYWEEYKQHKKK